MRRTIAIAMAVVLVLAAAGCSDDGGDGTQGTEPPTTQAAGVTANEEAGLIAEAEWRAQQDAYLEFATQGELDAGSPLDLIARAERALRASEEPDLTAARAEDFEPIFQKLREFRDTGDFDVNRLITLWVKYGEHLDPGLADAIEERILAFKYWWTEPTPEGVVDSQYYWTENHQIIFLANEYIAGQEWIDAEFTNSGMTGAEHVAHAEERLRTWFDWRARFGFSEWLSNVYWTEDMKGVLLLAELADDPEIARLASMTLDVMMVELAGHIQAGTFGTTHGRSYQKDKLDGRDEDTFSIAKLAFDATPAPYANADTATLLAVANTYRPPQVAKNIATSTDTYVFQTTSSLPIDPLAPIEDDPEAPYGLTYEGEDGLMLWWGMGAQFPWQVVPTSVEAVLEYDLFETANFQQAADLAPIVESTDMDGLKALALSLGKQINPGLLSQVDTYTWRSPGVMLSTAQDWRPGMRGEQNHTWQATLDQDALVFTQHPRTGVNRIEDATDNTSYWTGDGGIPRSAQHENVNISIYSPQYEGDGGVGSGAYSFTYLDYTHAYFPTERFDEVVERDGWVIGRKGDGFVALWSHRPTEWRTYEPGEFTNDLTERFDLMAPGGPDNVWITEVANATDYAGNADPFDTFVTAITATEPAVVPRAGGYQVSYRSPSQGEVRFGWTPQDPALPLPDLFVDGEVQDLHPDGQRWVAPFATASLNGRSYRAVYGGASIDHDFERLTRITTK